MSEPASQIPTLKTLISASATQRSNDPILTTKTTSSGITYNVYSNSKLGEYIDASQFGTDKTGKTDSSAAIKAALKVANQEKAAVYLSGKLYITDQIVIDKSLNHVKGLFGDGMGETKISFDTQQDGTFNPNSNDDDIRKYAGILVDGVNNVNISNLSVEYVRTYDFYRKGQSYFGKVTGILVNDADNTLISGVEASGANRAGILFTSTSASSKDSRTGATYKTRVGNGEIDETDAKLPLGENNRVENSYLHHNRVGGVLVAYQEDFVANGNIASWNGSQYDGGTGYGLAALAGTYNFGITYTNNYTDHNYRKGLDVHDGTDIVIQNNVSNGDRLYGIAVYNRQYAMDNVVIKGNTVIQDPSFRLYHDDNLGQYYHGYAGIQLETNTQRRDLHTKNNANYEISGNKISGLAVYRDALHTYGIEFRNHEHAIDYTANITGNTIEGTSSKYLIAAINDTSQRGVKGAGSGTINISGNTAKIGEIVKGTVPIYVEEKNASDTLRGSVTVSDNDITINKTNGVVEGVQLIGNAETYAVTDNKLTLKGILDKSIISFIGTSNEESASVTISDNDLTTSSEVKLTADWLQHKNASYVAIDNTHNGKAMSVSSNLNTEQLKSFTDTKEAADAVEKELTTIFNIDKNAFESNALFTAYDQVKLGEANVYSYDALDDTYTINTLNSIDSVI
ncbi:right-handed parallel beta-helix repeat-containing protein [Neisseria iguanae]|uniref:Right-handed parallel beta-helix repeat-containing protein n=1 Tax=Neisseria iguanae TaxID=90242 RepID=A0A2P7TXQ9_9NEIS|nr:right-handed parallel beta-helix repeat-containing protein [Neisseria iguanae]PSJ79443.1 right-handed parallel beta-helix repeat-containing protein [Neisseria iguanae]